MAIPKERITELIESIAAFADVHAPVRRGDTVVFERIRSASDAVLDHSNSTVPPKDLVFPRMETLLSSGGCGKPQQDLPGPVVLFGTRPCDARAFLLLDRVFGEGENPDTYYLARRASLTVVSIGCTKPEETCFCSTTGGGPVSRDGSDVLLEDAGDRYLVHVVTGRGAGLAAACGLKVDDAGEAAHAGPPPLEPSIEPEVDLGALKDALDRSFDDPMWRSVSEKCIGCGICTFLCPACHCFDMVDEESDGVCARKRIWDSCQFSCFTEQASGFNPRPTVAERYRQRIMHKFSYCIDRYGMAACVGCGRCVSECPVNLDIRQVLADCRHGRGTT